MIKSCSYRPDMTADMNGLELLQGIKKRAELSIASFQIDIYSSEVSFTVCFNGRHALCVYCSQHWNSKQLAKMDLQDGKWIREDEETPVNRGTSKPGTWCFVFSKFRPYLLSLCLQPSISLSFQDGLLWFRNSINVSCSVFLSFLSNLLQLGSDSCCFSRGVATVMFCCFRGWGSCSPVERMDV